MVCIPCRRELPRRALTIRFSESVRTRRPRHLRVAAASAPPDPASRASLFRFEGVAVIRRLLTPTVGREDPSTAWGAPLAAMRFPTRPHRRSSEDSLEACGAVVLEADRPRLSLENCIVSTSINVTPKLSLIH